MSAARQTQFLDNASLSGIGRRKRGRRHVETLDFLAMVRRMILAGGRRTGTADMEELVALIELHQAVEEAIAIAIPSVRDNGGYSWTTIGEALGMTRQGARQKYSKRPALAAVRRLQAVRP